MKQAPGFRIVRNVRDVRVALALAIIALLSGCGAMLAQNPASALTPVNAVADGADDRVMLKGHDVVAYFTLADTHPVRPSSRASTKA